MTPQDASRGGRARTPAKVAAARENGKRGGRRAKAMTIARLQARAPYTLVLGLSNGETVERDCSELVERLPGPFGAALREKFLKVRLVDGAPTWPGGFDYDPCDLIHGRDWPHVRRVPKAMVL